ncbi:MAG: hypothetical protein IKA22_10430 [Lentisphaeria bacterium]|nr:hypothetical protein [Lentisphaeria bacterium]
MSDTFLSPMLIIRDGKKGKWGGGESYPIPRYTTQENGSVVISGYDYVDTVFQLLASVTETIKGGSLALDISISSVTSFI